MTTTSPPARPTRRPASISNTSSLASLSPPTSTGPASTAGRATSPNPSGTTLTAKGSISRTNPGPKAIPPVRRTTANPTGAGHASRPSSALSNPRDAISKDGMSAKPKENGVNAKNEGETPAAIPDGNHEELLVRIQELDNTVSTLATQNATLQTSLSQAETRVTELYADQARAEEELGLRHELAEKLRSQLKEVEKEKRELTRRYNEQTAAFEAERQSFYDNEQHLKSRIQALTQSRKEHQSPRKRRPSAPVQDDTVSIVSEAEFPPSASSQAGESGDPSPAKLRRGEMVGGAADVTNGQEEMTTDDDTDPAEMTALKLELSTLSTSHASLQSTLHLLQSQLLDLQRVNAELQEENEGWKVLVQQRTLAGTFDILTLGGANVNPSVNAGGEDGSRGMDDGASLKSLSRNPLDKVSEMDEIAYELEKERANGLGGRDGGVGVVNGVPAHIGRSLDSELQASAQREGSPVSSSRRSGRRKGTLTGESSPKGETLADLPITGPGLDLAAELGRAQNADGFIDSNMGTTSKPKKVLSPEEAKMKAEMDSLRTEVKNLKDANKALSLYASKIIDRIIATEGFEDVLAVDFQEKQKSKAATAGREKQPRPGSLMFGMSESTLGSGTGRTLPPKEKLTTFESIGLSSSSNAAGPAHNAAAPPAPPPKPVVQQKQSASMEGDSRRSRRSMSFDWRGFSLFGGGGSSETEKSNSNSAAALRPLQLRPGAATGGGANVVGVARKLDTMEDEEDRVERERLKATMRLMGIDAANERPQQHHHQPYQTPAQAAAATQLRPLYTGADLSNRRPETPPSPKTAVATTSNRWSFFGAGKKSNNNVNEGVSAASSSSSLVRPESSSGFHPPPAPTSLTTEALQRAEAESHLAALDAREKVVKEEIARGGPGGFTELAGLGGNNQNGVGGVGGRKRIGEEWRMRRSGSGYGGAGSGGSGSGSGSGLMMMGLSRSRSMRDSKEGSETGSANTVWSAGNEDD